MQKEIIDSLLAKLDDDSRLMTLEELRYLKSAFDSFEGRLHIEEKLISAIESASDRPCGWDFDGLFARIEKRIKSQRRRRTLVWRVAAAVMVPLALACGIWLYADRGTSQQGIGTIARIEGNVRLTMPDGSEIVLDNTTENARISEREDVILTRENGSLIIESADNAPEEEAPSYGSIYVPRGTRFDMVLEDGTRVWLNSDSRLRFPAVFTGGQRRVFLEGEAFFEVAHDTERPFTVETSEQELTVLGTSFNISAYSNDAVTVTTLVEGSISLRAQEGTDDLMLRPGQQTRLNAGEKDFTTVEVKSFTPWQDGIFVFEGNTLEQVMRQLARWYDMEYTFEDDDARGLVLRGIMPVQAQIGSIFDILETSGKVKFTAVDNKVTIRTI